jgi:hypothetical protein
MKRYHIDNNQFPSVTPRTKNVKQFRDYQEQQQLITRCKRSSCDWSLQHRKKAKRISEEEEEEEEEEQQYHCQVYLKLFPSTLKCSLDVIVKSTKNIIDDDIDSILIAKTRIPKLIKPGKT